MAETVEDILKLFDGTSLEDIDAYREKLCEDNPPIKISFQDFKEGNYEEGARNLYIVWMGQKCLYVGISTHSIHGRWFSLPSSHYYGMSAIGRAVCENKPDSLSWEIEMIYFQDDLEYNERELIRKLKPIFNVTYNNAKRTKKEIEEDTDIYNLLLWGNRNHIANEGVILP